MPLKKMFVAVLVIVSVGLSGSTAGGQNKLDRPEPRRQADSKKLNARGRRARNIRRDAFLQNSSGTRSVQELLSRQNVKLNALKAEMAAMRILLRELRGRELPLPDRNREEGFRALYVMSRDGSNVLYLTAAPGKISSGTPVWSRNGTMIAFDSLPVLQAFSKSQIFVIAVEGPFKGKFQNLGYGNVPSWSPDDRQIVFMLNNGNPARVRGGIWTMDADGTNRKWLCRGMYPRWSPDGKEICYHANFNSPPNLNIYNVEAGNIRKVLSKKIAAKFGGAGWSPDGKKLVFIAEIEGKEHIATIDADGNAASLKLLHTEPKRNRGLIGPPSWSPDGKQIVFAIQDRNADDPNRRRWHHSYIYSISVEVPDKPVLLESEKIGLINRGMEWSPDSSKIVFSSER